MKKLMYAALLMLLFPAFTFAKSGFTLWQLGSQTNDIGNSYVFLTDKGKVIVMDGGTHNEELYLRGFLAALGNEVEAWFVSHPHEDHVGAFLKILKNPNGIKIHNVYYSEYPESLIQCEAPCAEGVHDFYNTLKASGINLVNMTEPGLTLKIDGLNLKVLAVTNPEITTNPYNNSSSVFRVWDKNKSIVFLGDLGVEAGDKLMKSPYHTELDCNYMQMAHHGQQGVSKEFYDAVKFDACLWSTPTWVWNNDIGQGFNTHILKTVDTRNWMKEKGIKKHYVSNEGLTKIE